VHGRRPNRSRAAILSVLRTSAQNCGALGATIKVDKKTVYPSLIRRAFRGASIEIRAYSSRLRRNSSNPLFKINLTNAIARDACGRLRRRSWLVSKKRSLLNLHLNIFIVHKNYIRVRFTDEKKTPAQLEGFTERPLRPEEVLSWRQSWGTRFSIHPRSRGGSTVYQVQEGIGV
jgi:hypothetical protein